VRDCAAVDAVGVLHRCVAFLRATPVDNRRRFLLFVLCVVVLQPVVRLLSSASYAGLGPVDARFDCKVNAVAYDAILSKVLKATGARGRC
jgi:hypothetical protein